MTKIREHLEDVLKAEGTFRDREYSICDDRGYLIDVLQPIIDARDGITECVEIRLEHETHYDWVAFMPQSESDAGEDDFKIRGIEARQRSTPPFIKDTERDCLERLDATRSSDAVLDCLQDAIKRLHAGTVPVEQLVERNRISKPLVGNAQNNQNMAALKRACEQNLAVHP